MTWKSLKRNPPEDDDVVICLKDPNLQYRGNKQYSVASYMQPDPDEPKLGAFLVTQTLNKENSCITNISDLPDDMLYIELEDIL